MLQYSIILTICNEQASIGRLVSSLACGSKSTRRNLEIIAIDDGSTDATWSILCSLNSRFPALRLHRNPLNMGRGYSIKKAVSLSSGDVLCIIDADLQYSPKDLFRAISFFERSNFDLVCGTRDRNLNLPLRRFFSSFFNLFCRIFFRVPVPDCNSGIKVGRVSVFRSAPLEAGAYRFLVASAKRSGFRIGDILIGHYPRSHGSSRISSFRIFAETFLSFFAVLFHPALRTSGSTRSP